MKNSFIFLAILIGINLIFSVSAFESEPYTLSTNVQTGGVDVNITNPLTINVTASCTTGETTCSGTNYYTCVSSSWINNGNVNGLCSYTTPVDGGSSSSSGSGSGGGSLLSTVIKSVFNDEKNKTEEETNKEENPEETTTSTNLFTGFAIGVSDFAKSPTGIATFIIVGLFVVGGVTFLVIKKGKFPKIFKKKEVNSVVEKNNS